MQLCFAKELKHSNVTYLNISARADTLPIIELQGFLRYRRGQFIAVPAVQILYDDNQAEVMDVDGIQRRILVRWEYFLGFVQLVCLVILFRPFLDRF